MGELTQMLGPLKRTVAYFSKQLDLAASGWTPCLGAVAATCLLIKEAEQNYRSAYYGLDPTPGLWFIGN